MNIKYHPDVHGYAVNVKTLHMHFPDGGTEGQRERAWEATHEVWWDAANEVAKEEGFDGASGAGRSCGWCAPYDTSRTVPENSSLYYLYVDDENDKRLPKFVERIEALLREVPAMYKAELERIVEEDREEEKDARRHAEVARQVRRDAINFLAKNGAERLADMVEERWEIEE